MFLEKYKNKKRLGRGAYGDVYLVQDHKGKSYALKMVSLKLIHEEPHLQQYIEGQIECMRTMNSPHIVGLHAVEKDQQFYYFLLEYCDGGDLVSYQAKLSNRVFTLEKATEVLSQVIEGLQALHEEQYLHRDIKSENVLVKNEGGREIFKLADFGFSKKSSEVEGTILGTEQFMSPEIFLGDDYGYQVDVWAFGVLFYFMLNLEYPFKSNPLWPPYRKEAELRKQAQGFSYTAAVKKSKRKLMEKCNAQMEDLFRQIFEAEPQKRINFVGIRKHPIFLKHFPDVAASSIILYSKKYKRKEYQPSGIYRKKSKEPSDDVLPVSRVIRKKNQKFQAEWEAVERKKDEVDFLRDNSDIFMKEASMLSPAVRLMLCYNLHKYYVILLRQLEAGVSSQGYLEDHFAGLRWAEYLSTDDFRKQLRNVKEDIGRAEIRFGYIYDECEGQEKQIAGINSSFRKAFRPEVTETGLVGDFKESYRKSTTYAFGVLRDFHKKNERKGNRLNYLLCVLLISNSFNNFFSETESLESILGDYLRENNRSVDKIDFSELRDWLSRSSQSVLNDIAKSIVIAYFGS